MNQEAMWSKRYRGAGEQYLYGTEPNRFLLRKRRCKTVWKIA